MFSSLYKSLVALNLCFTLYFFCCIKPLTHFKQKRNNEKQKNWVRKRHTVKILRISMRLSKVILVFGKWRISFTFFFLPSTSLQLPFVVLCCASIDSNVQHSQSVSLKEIVFLNYRNEELKKLKSFFSATTSHRLYLKYIKDWL